MSGSGRIAVTPLTPAIGARVDGLDLREPLDAVQQAELRDALWRHLVLFFRAQDLTDAQHVAFASNFSIPSFCPSSAMLLSVTMRGIAATSSANAPRSAYPPTIRTSIGISA